MKIPKIKHQKIIYPGAVYATYITYGSVDDFEYKDKSRWPKFGRYLWHQISSIGDTGFFYTLDVLLNDNQQICKTKKEKLKKLKEGAYFYWGDNGGGRSEIIRRLTKEEINQFQHLENLKYEIHNNQVAIQKYIPKELTENKNKLNSELAKHKKLMVKEGLLL